MTEMADYGVCADCGKIGWLPHRCAEWEWRSDASHSKDDWSSVRARDAEEAAEKAAEKYDQDGDYYLMRNGGDAVTVEIRDPKTLMVSLWKVHGEAIPTYYAKQITCD